MSVPDIASIFDVLRVKRTELIGDAKSVISAFFKTPDADSTDPIQLKPGEDETAPVDWWQHYGFVSRPPKDAEALLARFGANIFAVASRLLAAASVYGKLSEGDVALFSIGGNTIRLNADGAVSILVKSESGNMSVIRLSPGSGEEKGANLKVLVDPGLVFEMSKENGIVMNAGDKDVTIAGKAVNITAMQLNNNVGLNKLHMGAVSPLITPTAAAPNVFM